MQDIASHHLSAGRFGGKQSAIRRRLRFGTRTLDFRAAFRGSRVSYGPGGFLRTRAAAPAVSLT